MSDKPKTLREKQLAVMAAVGTLEKDGTNTFHKYKYTTAANLFEHVKAACVAERLVLQATVEKCEIIGDMCLCHMRFTLCDVDSGDSVDSVYVGAGKDSGDKGPYKAYTGALKYFLFQTFLVATDDDPENEQERRGKKSTPPPADVDPAEHVLKTQITDVEFFGLKVADLAPEVLTKAAKNIGKLDPADRGPVKAMFQRLTAKIENTEVQNGRAN